MGWSSDLESGGSRFDSRLPEGHFGVISGSLFRQFWDVLGCVWEWFRDVFGWFWDGLGKNVGRGRKMKIFKNDREYFSGVGALKIHFFRLSRTKFWKIIFCRIFVYKLPIYRLKQPLCYGSNMAGSAIFLASGTREDGPTGHPPNTHGPNIQNKTSKLHREWLESARSQKLQQLSENKLWSQHT